MTVNDGPTAPPEETDPARTILQEQFDKLVEGSRVCPLSLTTDMTAFAKEIACAIFDLGVVQDEAFAEMATEGLTPDSVDIELFGVALRNEHEAMTRDIVEVYWQRLVFAIWETHAGKLPDIISFPPCTKEDRLRIAEAVNTRDDRLVVRVLNAFRRRGALIPGIGVVVKGMIHISRNNVLAAVCTPRDAVEEAEAEPEGAVRKASDTSVDVIGRIRTEQLELAKLIMDMRRRALHPFIVTHYSEMRRTTTSELFDYDEAMEFAFQDVLATVHKTITVYGEWLAAQLWVRLLRVAGYPQLIEIPELTDDRLRELAREHDLSEDLFETVVGWLLANKIRLPGIGTMQQTIAIDHETLSAWASHYDWSEAQLDPQVGS